MACRIALNSTSSSNGLVKNSTAPAFIAWTVIGTSPCPVMKMIGMSVRSDAISFCNSSPLRSGREISSTKQLGMVVRGYSRNSPADANVSGCQPANLISNSSDSRTDTSSSTTKTIGCCCDFAAADIMFVQMLKSTRLQRSVKCLQEIRGLKRLEQAVHGALGDQTRANRCITVCRDEDDWDRLIATR